MDLPQSRHDLERHLAEQIAFLAASCEAYDRGATAEAKRMAVVVRVLVHKGRNSNPLLGQLGLMSLRFVDGAEPPGSRNVVSVSRLVVPALRPGVPSAQYIPKYLTGRVPPRLVPFEEWWNRAVIVDDEGQALSRRDIVLALANKDGGVHVDPTLGRSYGRLSRQNSAGWTLHTSGGSLGPIEGIERESMRQIAWEVQETLRRRESDDSPT